MRLLAACLLLASAPAFGHGVPDPFEIPKAPHGEGLPGWVDPFLWPADLRKPPMPTGELPGWVDPDWPGFKASPDATASERAAVRQRRLELFGRDSPFPANPSGDVGVFRFDLAMVQFLDSSRAKGKFTQYVNSRDGSVALTEPERMLQALGGRPIPQVALHFVLLRPGGNGLACGRHKAFGNACISAGGELSVADGMLLDYTAAMSWFNSIARTPQDMPPTPAGVRPGPLDRPLRGKLADGGHLSLWHDPVVSRVSTQVPWLGFGAGLFKDYRARTNRVARVVIAEGADLNGGDVGFRLVAVGATDYRFDTTPYRLVSAFETAAIDEAREIGLSFMGETTERAQEIDAALRACEPGEAGRLCRAKYRRQMQELNEAAHQQVREWAQRHGLPVPD